MKTLIDPTAADKIEAAHPRLKAGCWGGTHTVCMMSALVRGAGGIQDCVTAGWPEWLAELNVSMFDANVGAECEETARYQFALDVAYAVQVPRDYDKARDLFLIATLNRAKKHDTAGLCQRVIRLLHRRIAGQDVADAMRAAQDAAQDAANAAAYAATYAANAAYAAARAARAAANAALRQNLIAALNAA
jgi:hypothetical protein